MGNKKKKEKLHMFIFCILLFAIYIGLSGTGQATVEDPFTKLKKILQVMDKHEITMTDWTLYARENLNSWTEPGEYENEFKEIKKKTKQFKWQSQLNEDHSGQKKAIATLVHHDQGVTETLTYIVYPHKKQLHSYLIYEVQSNQKVAENQWNKLSSIVSTRYQDLFKNNTKIFTCATGIGNDKLNFGLYEQAEVILDEFSAQQIELLKEETFISVSAYTNTWNNLLTTNEQTNMNLQIAIRAKERLGGKTTVTIGTPIITTEY